MSTLKQDNEKLYQALDRLVRAYQFRDRQRACYYELSVNQCYALQTIVHHRDMTQNDLAAELRLDKSTTSRLVSSMEDSGYITRHADPHDGRAYHLRATAAGKRLHEKVRSDLLARQADLLADLSDESRQAAVLILQRLADLAAQSFAE